MDTKKHKIIGYEMTKESKVERYFCNECKKETKHHIRAEHKHSNYSEEHEGGITRILKIIECCGCEHLSFVNKENFSQDIAIKYNPITREPEEVLQ